MHLFAIISWMLEGASSSFSITSTTKKKFGHPWSSLLSVCLSACPPLFCLLLLSTQLSPKGLCCIAPHKKVILQCLCLVLFVTIHHPSIHLADHNALSWHLSSDKRKKKTLPKTLNNDEINSAPNVSWDEFPRLSWHDTNGWTQSAFLNDSALVFYHPVSSHDHAHLKKK